MSLRQILRPSGSPPSHTESQASPSHRHLPPPWDHIRTQKTSNPSHPPDTIQRALPYSTQDPTYNAYGDSPFYHPVHLNSSAAQSTAPGGQILQSLYEIPSPDERSEPAQQVSPHGYTEGPDNDTTDTSFSDLEGWDDLDTTFGYYVTHDTSTSTSQSTSATIDLTQDPESPIIMPSRLPRKRRASQLHGSPSDRSTKRQRSSGPSASTGQESGQGRSALPSRIEEIDLADDDDEVALVLQKQREEQVLSQYKKEGRKKSKLCELSCAVCMEPPTDLTATVCGHYFCRDCLLRWLAASEKEGPRKSNCPSCRKPISRTKKNDVIPLEIMTVKAKTKR